MQVFYSEFMTTKANEQLPITLTAPRDVRLRGFYFLEITGADGVRSSRHWRPIAVLLV